MVLEELRAKQPRLALIREDLSGPSKVTELVAGHGIVLSAVPGFMGYATPAAIVEAGRGRDVVDISLFAQDPFALDDRAVRAGVTAIVDCGVAPGLSNLLIEGRYEEPGIALPEMVGRHKGPSDFVIGCRRERKVVCRRR